MILQLKKILPELKSNDLVGRETYRPEKILSLTIPRQPDNFIKDLQEIKKLKDKKEETEKQIRKLENKY